MAVASFSRIMCPAKLKMVQEWVEEHKCACPLNDIDLKQTEHLWEVLEKPV